MKPGYQTTEFLFGTAIFLFLLFLACFESKGESSIVFVKAESQSPPDTGIVVGADGKIGIVITSGHTLDHGPVLVGDGKTWQTAIWQTATKIGQSTQSDVGALLIQWTGPSSILATTNSKIGESVWTWGAGSNYHRVNVLTCPDDPILPNPSAAIALGFRAEYGDSGAPLFGVDEQIVGIVVGRYGEKKGGNEIGEWISYGPNAQKIRENLSSWGWDCSGGKCRRVAPGSAWTPTRITVPPPVMRTPGQVVMGLPGKQGIPGQPGPPGRSIVGPQGRQGPPGSPGRDATFDLRGFPPFTIEILGENGQVAQTITVPIGGTLQLPPMTMTTIGSDGKVHTRTRPLGGEFKLGFFRKDK